MSFQKFTFSLLRKQGFGSWDVAQTEGCTITSLNVRSYQTSFISSPVKYDELKKNLLCLVIGVYVHKGCGTYVKLYLEGPEDNLWESGLSINHVDLRNEAQVIRLGGNCLYQLSLLGHFNHQVREISTIAMPY